MFLRRPCICSENTSLAPQGICGYTRYKGFVAGSSYRCQPGKPRFLYGSWHSFPSEQRSEPSAGVGVPEGKDSPAVVAQFSLHVFHLGKSVWREHQGITSAVGALRIRDSLFRRTHNQCRKLRSCWSVKSPAFCSVLLPNPKCNRQRQKS